MFTVKTLGIVSILKKRINNKDSYTYIFEQTFYFPRTNFWK